MFGMLFGNLSASRKLLTIVTNNMIDTLDSFLSDPSVELNMVLQEMNGNTALHVCAQKGHHACIRRLLQKGADPDKTNAFGFSPLAMALRYDQLECVRLLLVAGGTCSNPYFIWQSQQRSETYTWIGYSQETIEALLKATPNLRVCDDEIVRKLYNKFVKNNYNYAILKLLYKTGNVLPTDCLTDYLERKGKSGRKMIKELENVLSLRHCCRIVIRRNLKPNVFYGESNFPNGKYPPTLKSFLIFEGKYSIDYSWYYNKYW